MTSLLLSLGTLPHPGSLPHLKPLGFFYPLWYPIIADNLLLIRRLLVSCRELGPRSAGGGQGGVASGRVVPSGGLHRHEHDGWPRRNGAILQWTRNSGSRRGSTR